MRREGHTVNLDLSPVERLQARFPGAYSHLAGSPRGEELLLPVRPAAHYTIGGVLTDLQGQTTVSGLYACGEVASVGVHGANRLASNSLLEGLVFGHRAARHACASLRGWTPGSVPQALNRIEDPDRLADFRGRFEEATGVVREASGLRDFLAWLEDQDQTMERDLAGRVAAAALARNESVGAHFRTDSSVLKFHVAG